MTQQTQPVLLSDYDYHLPDDLIARYPLNERTSSRLLHVSKKQLSRFTIYRFTKLIKKSGDLLVLNDTKVIKARLHGQKNKQGERLRF